MIELVKIYKETQSKEVLEKIYRGCEKLFLFIIRKHFVKHKSLHDDMQQECFFTLLKALKKYDPEKNVKFSYYIYRWVYDDLKRYIQRKGYFVKLPYNVNPEELTEVEHDKLHLSITYNFEEDIDAKIFCEKVERFLDIAASQRDKMFFLEYFRDGYSTYQIGIRHKYSH